MNSRVRIAATMLVALIVGCGPALAIGADDVTRQILPPQTESGMYDKQDLQSDSGPIVPLPRVPVKPVIIDPTGDSPATPLTGQVTAAASGFSAASGGLAVGAGTVDPVLGAEREMRKLIRRLD